MPEAITYSDVRKNLASTMDKVCDGHDPIIITRQKAQSVVMMSLEEFNSIVETAYLMQSPANAERLRNSINAAQTGKTKSHNLMED